MDKICLRAFAYLILGSYWHYGLLFSGVKSICLPKTHPGFQIRSIQLSASIALYEAAVQEHTIPMTFPTVTNHTKPMGQEVLAVAPKLPGHPRGHRRDFPTSLSSFIARLLGS